jgi:enoyl-CoA hydratase
MSEHMTLYEKRGPVGLITLNRPDKLNAITPAMAQGLHRALDAAEADEEVRAVVLNGAGRAFSAGFDLEAGAWSNLAAIRREVAADLAVTLRFWRSPKPTLAAVHGYCLGGALELALACDLTVSDPGCRFGEPEVRFGSGVVSLLLPWITGPKQAKELLLVGSDRISAERALAMGLINRVVAEGEHLEAALAMARELAVNDATAVRLTKEAINRSYEAMGMSQALAQGADIAALVEGTETPESRAFNEVLRKEGVKAALAWRARRVQAAPDSGV